MNYIMLNGVYASRHEIDYRAATYSNQYYNMMS